MHPQGFTDTRREKLHKFNQAYVALKQYVSQLEFH